MYMKLGNLMTLLGLCAMGVYGLMLVGGDFSFAEMPQFIMSSLVFLGAGKVMRTVARGSMERRATAQRQRKLDLELLSWVVGMVVLSILALLLLIPLGAGLENSYLFQLARQLFGSVLAP